MKSAIFDHKVRSVTRTDEGEITNYSIVAFVKPEFADPSALEARFQLKGQLRLEGSGYYSVAESFELNDEGTALYSKERPALENRHAIRASLEECLKATKVNGITLAAN